MDPESMSPEELEAARRSATIKRRSGFAILFVAMMAVCIPMVAGAIKGVQTDKIWDPFTGEPLERGATSAEICLTEAEELIAASASLKRVDPAWDDRVTAWTVRCRKDHGDIFQMLNDTRRKLRTRGKKKE